MKTSYALGRIILILAGLIAGIYAAVYAGEKSYDALRIATTVFSILSGMLIAIISLLGDPATLLPGSWRIASGDREQMKVVLVKYIWLLYAYLFVILLSFLVSLDIEFFNWDIDETSFLYRITIGLAMAAMVWSLGLPVVIYQAQVERYDREVETRKKPKSNPENDGNSKGTST